MKITWVEQKLSFPQRWREKSYFAGYVGRVPFFMLEKFGSKKSPRIMVNIQYKGWWPNEGSNYELKTIAEAKAKIEREFSEWETMLTAAFPTVETN